MVGGWFALNGLGRVGLHVHLAVREIRSMVERGVSLTDMKTAERSLSL